MDRAELERLDREALVLRAQAAGVRRARLLTRPELVDELLRLDPAIDESQLKKTRGFFGRARDLLSRVVERGLHLPDAADRLRAALGSPLPQVPRPEPQAVPTVTLAEIYAAQGHKQRAIETLKRVLETEPEHGAARALLERLQAADYVTPDPPLPPEPELEDGAREEIGSNLGSGFSPVAPLSEEEDAPETPHIEDPPTLPRAVPPARLDQDECVAVPVGEGSLYVWWQLSHDARRRFAEEPAFFFVRAVVLVPTWDGPKQETRDVACDPGAGEARLLDLPAEAVVRVAIGTIEGGTFIPLAHSPALEAGPLPALARWTLEGTMSVSLDAPGSTPIARAVEAASRGRG